MCGRFALFHAPDELAQFFHARPDNDLPPLPNYNICPTNPIHSVFTDQTGRRLSAMRWGFIPHWYKTENDGPLLINARAESLAEKPAFRDAARHRRCLIPASGFYEWQKAADGRRLPWFIRRRDKTPLAMAGIWQDWRRGGEQLRSCAIVTTEANREIAPIHNRMPVVLEPDDWPLWLGEQGKGAARLMRPAEEGILEYYRVDPKVNSNRASGPDLIEPLEE